MFSQLPATVTMAMLGPARYEVLNLIGRGGYAKVFVAWDHHTKTLVAVKKQNSQDCHPSLRWGQCPGRGRAEAAPGPRRTICS